MPITINHQLTATTPDNTSAEIRPSHWNSAHQVSLSLAGNEVIKYVSAGTNSVSSGTVQFSNSNGVTFGMDTGGVITASISATASQSNQTMGMYALSNTTGQSSSSTFDARSLSFVGAGIASVGYSGGSVVLSVPAGGGAGDGGNVLAAGTQTATSLGTVAFANSNGITFGMSGSTQITASHNGITSQTAQTQSNIAGIYDGANSISTGTVRFTNANGVSFTINGQTISGSVNTSYAASNHSHGNPTLALTNLTGTTASASNGFTLSLSAAAPSAASLSVYAPGNSTVNSSGTFSVLSMRAYGILSMGTSNGSLLLSTPDPVDFTQLSVGFSTNGNTAGDTGLVTGRMVLAGGANITLSGSTNAGSVTVSIVGGAGGGGGVGISAGTQSVSTGTMVFSNSNNLTFGMSGSSRITMSGALNLYALGNTTQNSSTVLGLAAVSFNGLGAATMGFSNGSVQVSVPTQTAQSIGLYASSQTTGQSSSSTVDARSLSLVGAGNVSVGLSAGSFIISGAAGGQTNQTLGLYATGNTTNNSSTTFDARTLGTYNALGAITMGFSNGSIQVSAPATSSLSATGLVSISTNGSTISIGVPGTTGSFLNPSVLFAQSTSVAIGNGSVFVQPMQDNGRIASISRMDVFANVSVSSSSNSSHAGALSFTMGVYTRNGSTLSLASSGSQSYQWTNTSNDSMGSISSVRRFSVPINAVLTGGDYWVAVASRSNTTNADWFTAANLRASIFTDAVQGLMGEASNQTRQLAPGLGLWSTTSTALPASIALGDLRGHGTGVANNGLPVMWNGCNFTA